MDLYTLTEDFLAHDVIDEFVSAIWTERYSSAGDVRLVVPATFNNIDRLAEGTYLARRGTKEVMQIETQNIEKGLLTVIGGTLLTFFDQRLAWFVNPADTDGSAPVADYEATAIPGPFIADAVDKTVINPASFGAPHLNGDLDWDNEIIPYLSLGAVDGSGVAKALKAPIGPLYDAIVPIAQAESLGLSLYLEHADPGLNIDLRFVVYRGLDRTSDQSVNPLVRMTSDFESLSDLKEVRSISDYKNVAYVWFNGLVTEHLADPTAPEPEGLKRRVLLVNTSDGGDREQIARDALANHNYIRAMDGQTSPSSKFQYGVDYGLGDLIELESVTGTVSKARITEYIHSHDKQGEREYPTISVV